MGYRHKLGVLSKEKHDIIKDMTLPQLKEWYKVNHEYESIVEEEDAYVPCYDITKEIYELGKYYDDEFLMQYISPIFSNAEVEEYYRQDNAFYFISQAGFVEIIQDYHGKISKYFKELLEDKKDWAGRSPREEYFKSKLYEWDNKFDFAPYSLHQNKPDIVTSWKYEYAIFELVRIYKNIDWENEYATMTAW